MQAQMEMIKAMAAAGGGNPMAAMMGMGSGGMGTSGSGMASSGGEQGDGGRGGGLPSMPGLAGMPGMMAAMGGMGGMAGGMGGMGGMPGMAMAMPGMTGMAGGMSTMGGMGNMAPMMMPPSMAQLMAGNMGGGGGSAASGSVGGGDRSAGDAEEAHGRRDGGGGGGRDWNSGRGGGWQDSGGSWKDSGGGGWKEGGWKDSGWQDSGGWNDRGSGGRDWNGGSTSDWGGGGGGGKGGGSGKGRPGDWECPSCGAEVFASKSACFKCGTAKPGGGQKGGGANLEARQMDDINDLCEKFGIDERQSRRLADAMSNRKDTFREDIKCLDEVLANARNPPGLLAVKMREMEEGTFVAKGSGKGRDKDHGGRRDYDSGGGRGGAGDRRRDGYGSASPEKRRRSRSRDRKRSRSNERKRGRDESESPRRRRRRDDSEDSRTKSKKDKKDKKDKKAEKENEGKDRKKDRDREWGRDKDERGKDRDADRPYDREERQRSASRSKSPPARGSPDRGVQIAPPRHSNNDTAIRAEDPDDEVHYGIVCGSCHMSPLRGDRFKCSVCENYNLCEDCYDRKTEVHTASHRFFVQKAVRAPPPDPEPAPPPVPEDAAPPPSSPPVTAPNPLDFLPQMQLLEAQMKAAAEATGTKLDPALLAKQMEHYLHTLSAQSAVSQPPQPEPVAAPPPEPAKPPPSPSSSPSPPPRRAAPASPSPQRQPSPARTPAASSTPAPASKPEVAKPRWREPEAKKDEEKAPPSISAWMPIASVCSLCNGSSTYADPHAHGVRCWRKRSNGSSGGCGNGVCWKCMEQQPRSKLGMVRTSREEFESLEDEAWWMHERCMTAADLRQYFGSEKELMLARQAADEADRLASAAASSSSKPGEKAKKEPPVDPAEATKAKVRAMSVKELKAYLDRHNTAHAHCVEKSELQALALEVASKTPEIPDGPAWMPVGMVCRLCTKPTAKEMAGIICRRKRADGTVGGCGEGICWRCMKRAPRESFGKVRTTKEEFESLEEDAWWMHEMCFEDDDYKDYFGESEPEDDKKKRIALKRRRLGEEEE